MAVANKQVGVGTNNNENLQRLEKTAPEARKNIRVIWTSPLIPSDPLVWRKDLATETKVKLYTWLLSYGRTGTPEEKAAAKKVLTGLQWAPFSPTNNDQLLPMRILEANRNILKVKGDDKISDAEKAAKVAEFQKEIDDYQAHAAKAEQGAFAKRRAAFLAADKAGNEAELRKMIGELAAVVSTAQTN